MSVWRGTPAARACNACARPIAPPSAVTAALFDMFCGLNGATDRPRLRAARQRPATRSDLPTLLPVPWIISARGIASAGIEKCRQHVALRQRDGRRRIESLRDMIGEQVGVRAVG